MTTQCFWYIGQAGILLEIMGASLVVVFAFLSRKTVGSLKTDLDHIQEAVDTVLSEVASQFRKQVIGFALLAIGLTLQFIGNFGST